MNYKLLRISLLSMLVMLFSGVTLGALLEAESETIFSATVTATAKTAFSPGTTEISSDMATISGGKMYAISEQTTDKDLIGKQSSYFMFCMTNNNTYFKVELDKALAVGDVISAMTYSRTDTDLGLWLSTAETRPGECATALTIDAVSTAAYEPLSSYTVAEGDGLAGATTFFIYRATGKSTYFNEFTITRSASSEEPEPAINFVDIKADFTDQSFFTEADANGATAGLKMNEDGTFTRVAADDPTANAVISGKYHSADHGISNFSATVPVEGTVKITFGTCAWGGDVTVKNADGETVATFNTNTGACYHSDKENNVVYAYYKQDVATTLTISGGAYVPYFAVEKIDPKDLPSDLKFVFDATESGAQGVAPAEETVGIGKQFTIPKNFTLYKEGETLTGWTDGTNTYAVGETITAPDAETVTLKPVFTANEVSLADRTESVTVKWNFRRDAGAPSVQWQNQDNLVWVAQATIAGKDIDVALPFSTNPGKFNNTNWTDWCQLNEGTTFHVPSCKGATISMEAYNNITTTTIDGQSDYAQGTSISYEIANTASSVDVVIGDGSYYRNIQVVLPVPSQEEPNLDVTGTWNFGDTELQAAVMALSGTTETGEIEAVEKNGLKMTVEANGATFRINGDNMQVRKGATFKIPVKNAGDLITVNGYPGYSYYTIGNSTDELNNDNTYKAKLSDAEAGYVAVTSTNDNNYYKVISVVQYAPKEKITLDNEASTATFPFNEGTEGQKATFTNADYYLSSKVTHGSNWNIQDKTTYAGTTETRLTPVDQHESGNLTDDDAVSFIITPKPGFTFTPTKVAFKANRYGTDNGLIDAYWLNSDGTTVELEKGINPERNNSNKTTEKSYDITGSTPGEGSCGLKLFLYHLQAGKQIGLADIVIEGVLNGTEKDVPVLASFKINGNEYAVEDVFGEQYEATLKLPKAEAMVSSSNPLTDVTATTGELGEITYDEQDKACTVTIPMTAGDTQMNYVLNVIYKPDYQLEYIGVDGSVLATQAVEEDAAIGEFAFDIANAPATKDGYKARGWFKTPVLGAKFTIADVITANTKLYAIQTEIEEASTHKKYFFDLADQNFYAEDHEAFNPAGEGYYWHDAQHGWAFKNGNTVDLLVGPKATVTVILCQYGSGTGIVVKKGDEVLATLPGIAEGDGGTAVYNYEGEAGTLTLEMQCGGEMYIHGMKIVNTAEVNFDSQDNWYFVKAGDAGSLLEVLDVVNGKNASKDADRSIIFLPNGTYDLDATVKTSITGHNISIVGQSMDKTIIVTKPDVSVEGLGKADLFDNSGTNLYLQDLTLQNALDYYAAGSAGRAAVLQDAGNRTIGKRVRMLSFQDTYYSSNSSQQAYWEECDIHGTVDFICGGGDIRFQNTTITLEPRDKNTGKGGRTVVAPTTNTKFGYVFDGCKVVDLAEGKGDWNFGRTWQNQPITVYLNTTLDDNAKNTLVASRWTQRGMNNKDPKLFGEYGTKDAAGNDITPASNIIKSFGGDFETILKADQAAEFAYDKMFTDWDPAFLAIILPAPTDAVYDNGTVTFRLANNGMCGCALFKNGEFVGISTNGTFNIAIDPAQDELTIRAFTFIGALGDEGHVAGTTGIDAAVRNGQQGADAIYTLQGVRVNKAEKGIYIINGRKVAIK